MLSKGKSFKMRNKSLYSNKMIKLRVHASPRTLGTVDKNVKFSIFENSTSNKNIVKYKFLYKV